MTQAKIRVGVLVGGASSEREISLASGTMIAEHLPRESFDVVLLDTLALMAFHPRLPPHLRDHARALLTTGGRPEVLAERDRTLPRAFQDQIRQAAQEARPANEALIPRGGGGPGIDVAFLALHGPWGEDGTVQGMLDLLGVPYVGSGTLSSALCMDKAMAKRVLAAEGIPTPRGLVLDRREFGADPGGSARRAGVFLPAVVKPVRQGSSIGMSLASGPDSLGDALAEAFAFDSRVLVEERVVGTELTVGILGNRDLQALPVVEIVSKREFFDYQAKYDPALSEEICPARIPAGAASAAQELALRAHRALQCRGFSRVDLIQGPGGAVVLEVNTLPGMTVNSLLPKAAAVAGIPFPALLERLVRLALEPED